MGSCWKVLHDQVLHFNSFWCMRYMEESSEEVKTKHKETVRARRVGGLNLRKDCARGGKDQQDLDINWLWADEGCRLEE